MLFTRTTPLPQLGLWTFEPAFSPRFSFPLSPRSFFHTRQRFPNSNHVTSGCMSPRSTFDQWSAVSRTGNDMTSSSDHVIALDQSGARITAHTGPLYYFYAMSSYIVGGTSAFCENALIPNPTIYLLSI